MGFLIDKLASRAEESARLYPDGAGTPEDTYKAECTIYDFRPGMVPPGEEPTPPYPQTSAARHGKRQAGVSIAGLWVVPEGSRGRSCGIEGVQFNMDACFSQGSGLEKPRENELAEHLRRVWLDSEYCFVADTHVVTAAVRHPEPTARTRHMLAMQIPPTLDASLECLACVARDSTWEADSGKTWGRQPADVGNNSPRVQLQIFGHTNARGGGVERNPHRR